MKRPGGATICILMAAMAFARQDLAQAGDPPGDAAVIGPDRISIQELETRSAKGLEDLQARFELEQRQALKKIERERQSLRERELGAMLDERVLQREAASQKTTTASLLDSIEPKPVTDQDVRAFFVAHAAQIGQPYDAVSARIRDFMQQQQKETARRGYLDSLRTKYHARVVLEPLREQVAATGPSRGPASAPVNIVVFSDFQCPFCKQYLSTLSEVTGKYPDQVRVIYRHLPLISLHPNAEVAAEASVCAARQGKFWELHDAMFAEQNALAAADLKEKAKKLGIESQSFAQCLDTGAAKPEVRADEQAADELGLGGTPASFINGRFLGGAASPTDLSAIIDDELRRLRAAAR
jgi:protein-disulfide isomerase